MSPELDYINKFRWQRGGRYDTQPVTRSSE